jgi:hypothetical protein
MNPLTRRELMIAGLGLAAGGCAGMTRTTARMRPAAGNAHGLGSTLVSTWGDPQGTGTLIRTAGEPLLARTELGAPRSPRSTLATLAHVTDAHVLDASSPARVPFLDRLGSPFQSTFRPQETLTAQVLAGALRAIDALGPSAVIQGGDLIDNDQANELARALDALSGRTVHLERYFGVQLAQNADPFYYRPDLDAPRHPGLLRRASESFRSPGLAPPWYPVLGDHDILVAGELPPSELTNRLAIGNEALWELPAGLSLPPGVQLTEAGSPDGPPVPGMVDQLLARALAGPRVRVPADPARRELQASEVVSALQRAARLRAAPTLDYSFDVGSRLRVIVLDLARRAGGSGGLVRPEQPGFLDSQLRMIEAPGGERWVIVVSHQPLASSAGGEELLALLDSSAHVIATLAGHTHRNRIEPRPTPSGGYWQIETASLIDYPQQARALRIIETTGGVAIETWMLDHACHSDLGTISRQLAYLDAQGGRPNHFAGARADRNATLYLTRAATA